MAQKLTNNQVLSTRSSGNNVSFRDMLVDLKPDQQTKKNTKRLRLIGEPIGYMEYSARKKSEDEVDDKGKPKIINCPFPDANVRQALTRIGHDDEDKCIWKEMGYIGSRKYAQNCLERQPDGSYIVKVLNKGATVFKPFAEWENGKVVEKNDEGDEEMVTFLGGRIGPEVTVTCHKDDRAPGGVKYEVHVRSKNTEITDEEIAALKAIYAPSEDEMKTYRKEYKERMESDPRLPDFEDFFEYGYNLRNIFKYTPLHDEDENTNNSSNRATKNEEEEDEEVNVVVPKKTKETKKVEEKASSEMFSSVEGEGADDDDDWEI